MIGSPATVASENFTVRLMTVWKTVSPHAETRRSMTSRLWRVRPSNIVPRTPSISSLGLSRSRTLSIVVFSSATPRSAKYSHSSGVALLKTTIDKVRERLNPKLEIDGVLGTMFDGRTLHSREVMERLVSAWGDKVFHTVIRRTVKFSDATVAGEPITSYASTSTGADAYRQLAKEVLTRWPAE